MDCPHCGKAFHDSWTETTIFRRGHQQPIPVWQAGATACPACGEVTIEIYEAELRIYGSGWTPFPKGERLRVYPTKTFRAPTPKEVPPAIKEDYEEACAVLPISEKASAALSRRCLQAILRSEGYNQHDLARQIDALLNEADPAKTIPSGLREIVDAIRNFGNFSAHPMTDITSLQVIPVEAHEAEWCLEILEAMFDHYYVKPAEAAARKAALNAKLASAGKPPSK